MTIETQTNRVQYIGNGVTTVFPINFPVYEARWIRLFSGTGVDQREITAGFQVTGSGTDTVNLVMAAAPAAGALLTILREVPYTQEMRIKNLGDFNPDLIEKNFDRLVLMIQQLFERTGRGIVAPESSGPNEITYTSLVLLRNDSQSARDQAQTAARDAVDQVDSLLEGYRDSAADSAARAEAAAGSVTGQLETYVDQARTAAQSALTDAGRAEDAAAAVHNLQAEATTLGPGTPATAEYDPDTGILRLGLPKGDQGDTGAGINILKTLDSEADLPASGNPGDAYLINNDLYVWASVAGSWENVGPIAGGGDIDAKIDAHDSSQGAHAAAFEALRAKIGVVTEFTSSGTFAAEAGAKYMVEVWGGGGSGGYSIGASNAYFHGAGGGSSGVYGREIITFAANENVAVTIGAGGVSTIGSATNGGASSFGSYMSAPGGLAGESWSPAMAGMARIQAGGSSAGPGSNPGGDAILNNPLVVSGGGKSGNGGISLRGRGGNRVALGGGNGNAATNGEAAPGRAGGGSGGCTTGAGQAKGGDGAPGLARITRLA